MYQSILSKVASIEPSIIQTRRDFYSHPELSNREEKTAAIIARRLEEFGIEVKTGIAKHGVVGILRGKGDRVIAARANMDALPIDDVLDVPYRSTVSGVKHACGHDAEAAILLGVAEVLSSLRELLAGTVVFIFQPAEEGLPMMASEDFSHFAEKIPGFYFFLGVRNESRGLVHMVHTPEFDIDESCLAFGVNAFSTLLLERTHSQRIN